MPAELRTLPLLTADELDTFPSDGLRYEIIEGELIVTPSPGFLHQILSRDLGVAFHLAARASDAGEVVFAPLDVRFSETDQVQPDIVFLRKSRLDLVRGHAIHGVPDIVVEILSPSNRVFDLIRKRALYELHGVPEYWIGDPVARTLVLLVLRDGRYVDVTATDGKLSSTVIPGLTIDISELFDNLDR